MSQNSDQISSESDDEGSGEIYDVEKIIDIRWEMKASGKEECRYRVRWKGYKPSQDTWEPRSSFMSLCVNSLQEFINTYKQLRMERVALLRESGQDVSLDNVRHANILSREIEEIRYKEVNKSEVFYCVKWHGSEYCSMEHEVYLIHAQDKVDAFLHKTRVSQLKGDGKGQSQDNGSDRERRLKEREFYEALEKGEVVSMETDLYTRVKGRKLNDKEAFLSPNRPSTSGSKKRIKDGETHNADHRKCGLSSTDGYTSDVKNWAAAAGVGVSGSGKENVHSQHRKIKPVKESLLKGLPQYDPKRSEKEFKTLEEQRLTLSKEEFEAATEKNDYQTILASLRSDNVPELDFTSLFLKAARRGGRDIALLLATRVDDLSTRDEYGNSAICMAAKLGDVCFAHHLLSMGVSKRECNNENQTLQQIAAKFGQRHFIKFLLRYKK